MMTAHRAVILAELSGGSVLPLSKTEGGASDLQATFHEVVARTIGAHSGTLVRTGGSVAFATFTSASAAADAACALQRKLDERNHECDPSEEMRARIGVHVAGADAVTEAESLGVCGAIAGLARAGDICLSEAAWNALPLEVRSRCSPSTHAPGQDDEIRAYELRWSDATTVLSDGTLRAADLRVRLRTHTGSELLLDRENATLRFGRDGTNDLVVADEYASRLHGAIEHQRGKCYLVDQSSNGTLVVRGDGHTLHVHREQIPLDGRGTIRLGRIEGPELSFVVEMREPFATAWTPQGGDARGDESPGGAANVFRLEGEYWTLRYEGTTLRLRDSKGLRYLAQILRHPGQELHAMDIVTETPGGAAGRARSGARAPEAGTGPVLDATAKAAYRERLADLQEELGEAESFNDVGRAERLREEIDFLGRELSAAVGLGGRDREVASNAERARVTVTLRIKDAMKKIELAHPSLEAHLTAAIKTGRFCSYGLPPAPAVSWEI